MLKRLLAIICFSLSASACSLLPDAHKIDVQQGNILNPSALQQVQLGMSQQQVRFLLGNPMVKDSFHSNRWDYVYYVTPAGKKPTPKVLSIYFEDNKVARLSNHYSSLDKS